MKLKFLCMLAGIILAASARAGDLSVAVASNFAAPMQKIADAFSKQTGHSLSLSFGSTGKFYAQIVHGAPFEVLLAADEATPKRLENEGLAVPGTRYTYAIGKLVLWSKQTGVVDDKAEVLQKGTFQRLALADPKLAPYGAAAMQALTKLGLAQTLADTVVQGENIGQAYQFVATQNATLGFVALSQVMENGHLREGSAWIVPDALYDPIRQDAIVLAKGRQNPVAPAFMQFLKTNSARAIMHSYGYGP